MSSSRKHPPKENSAPASSSESAMRFFRAHAAEYGMDPNRIAAGGGSAGGHLAAALNTIGGHDDSGTTYPYPQRRMRSSFSIPPSTCSTAGPVGSLNARKPGSIRNPSRPPRAPTQPSRPH
ncbi:MAG: alpha/beta hydrolase fold domain-containing protein [Pirellulales bacterium]